jgi:amino acid permease
MAGRIYASAREASLLGRRVLHAMAMRYSARASFRSLTTAYAASVATTARIEPTAPALVRTLGLWDVTAITAGTILGSAIFVAASFVVCAVAHPTLALLMWVAGGSIAVAGTLTYTELGTMFPAAGGQYQ